MQLSVSVWFQRLYHNLAGDRNDTNLLRHSRAGELRIIVQIRSFTILLFALIVLLPNQKPCLSETWTSLTSMIFLRTNELSFQVSFTKHQNARSLLQRSNPNSFVGFPSPTLSVHSLNQRKLSLHLNRHIHNFVIVLILRNLDLVVDLLLDDLFRFSARSSW